MLDDDCHIIQIILHWAYKFPNISISQLQLLHLYLINFIRAHQQSPSPFPSSPSKFSPPATVERKGESLC